MNKKMRVKKLTVSYAFFELVFSEHNYVLDEGLPEGSKLIKIEDVPSREEVIMFFEHSSFDKVDVDKCPFTSLTFKRIR